MKTKITNETARKPLETIASASFINNYKIRFPILERLAVFFSVRGEEQSKKFNEPDLSAEQFSAALLVV